MLNSIKYISFIAILSILGTTIYFKDNIKNFFIISNVNENYCIKDCEGKRDKYNLLSDVNREGTYVDINVSRRVLILVENYKVKKVLNVALGKNGYGKEIKGDLKTPIGEYEICDTRKSNGYHRFLQLNYPSKKDAKRGLEKKIINQREYNSIIESHKKGICPPSTLLGGFIGIHGESEKIPLFIPYDWTHGCIGINSREIRNVEKIIRNKRKKGKKVKVNIYKK